MPAASWTEPRTWVTSEVVTAAQMNAHVRDNFNAVIHKGYVKATVKTVNNSAATTDLLNGEVTIPASAVSSTGLIRGDLIGNYFNNSGAARNLTWAITLGGTTIWEDQMSAIAANAANRGWRFRFYIGAANSTSAQRSNGSLEFGAANGASTGAGDLNDVARATAAALTADEWCVIPWLGIDTTKDMTASQALVVNVTHSVADANLTIELEHAMIEIVP